MTFFRFRNHIYAFDKQPQVFAAKFANSLLAPGIVAIPASAHLFIYKLRPCAGTARQ
jgi:hypothetical protein